MFFHRAMRDSILTILMGAGSLLLAFGEEAVTAWRSTAFPDKLSHAKLFFLDAASIMGM